MQQPISPAVPVDFTLPDDQDNPTIFKVRPLTGAEYMRCMCYARATNVDPGNASVSMEMAIRTGLVGWQNFGDAEFSEDSPAENVKRLNDVQFAALGNEILRLSRLQFRDKKK